MSREELAEALKELTYEHILFSRRIDELTSLLDEDPSRAINEFTKFFKNVVLPHRDKEEVRAFPIILKLKPSEEPLINELINEHRRHLEEEYKSLEEHLIKGETVDAENKVKDLLDKLRKHIEREEPLYKLVLREALK